MKKCITYGLSFIGMCNVFASPRSTVGEQIEAKITVCRDEGCPQVVNAIGDTLSLDVSKFKIIEKGSVEKDITFDIELPKSIGESYVYSLTPTTGESQNKKIYIVLKNEAQRPGSQLGQATVIKFYRRIEDEKTDQWTELGMLSFPVKNTVFKQVPLVVKADGTALIKNPSKAGGDTVIQLGKKIKK